LINPLQLSFAIHAAERHKQVLIIVVCASLANEAFPKLSFLLVGMDTEMFLAVVWHTLQNELMHQWRFCHLYYYQFT
jgi:hypothetical protein